MIDCCVNPGIVIYRVLNDALSAAETHTAACDSMSELLSSCQERISKLTPLPLTHQACEPLAVQLISLKSDQHKLSQLLEEAESSVAALESLCGERSASKQRQKCDGMLSILSSPYKKILIDGMN